MNSKGTFLKGIAFIAFFAISVFLFILYAIKPEFYYFAQQPPFQANNYFLNSYLAFPGGISYYISLFLMQFFTINWLGSLIITITLLVLLFLAYCLFANLKKVEYTLFIIFFPVILLFGLFSNYYFPYTTAFSIILVYAFVYLSTLFLRSAKPKWFFYFFLAPILYYVGGGSCFMLYSISFLFLFINRLANAKKIIPVAVLVILFCLALPYISFKFLFHIPFSKAFFEYYPADSLLAVNYKKNIFFYVFFYLAPLLVLINEILTKFRDKKAIIIQKPPKKGNAAKLQKKVSLSWYRNYSILAVYILIIILSILFVKANLPVLGNKIVKANFYCMNEKWDEVLSTVKSAKDYDVNLNYFYNRAISNSDQYLDKYFDYPQLIGPAGTNPERADYGLLYMYWSDYYYDLGYISESQKWAYKALIGFPYCPMILKRIVKINIISGNYNSAEKFLNILDDNLLSAKFVDQYSAIVKDTALITENEEIIAKRALMPVNLITPQEMRLSYKALLNKNFHNKKAYEQMQMDLLLSHDFWTFYKNLPMASNYYTKLPGLFQEALIILRTKNDQIDISNLIEEPTMRAFNTFWNIYKANYYNKEKAMRLLRSYKNTLYYYILFDSPKITDLAIKDVGGDNTYH